MNSPKLNNWNKQDDGENVYKEDLFSSMKEEMEQLCDMLMKDSASFSAKEFYEAFRKYIVNNHNRLLYSTVTNAIFESYKKIGIFQTHLDEVISFSYTVESKDVSEKEELKKVQSALIKFWDHTNLAISQYELFIQDDEKYSQIAEAKLKDVEINITKEMNIQLISLIAIFTALAFVVFGGITSLNNICVNINDVTITKMMVVGSIWCFCLLNLVFVFMLFVAKLTGLEIPSTKDMNANLVQKYPLVWWSNLIVIAIFISSCWFYYVEYEGFSLEVYHFLQNHSTIYFIIGTVGLIGLFIVVTWILFHFSKKIKIGWQEEKKGWRYYNNNGKAVTNEWKKSGYNWYHLGKDGYIEIDKFILKDKGNSIYYVDENGVLVANTFVKNGNKLRYFDEDGKAIMNGKKVIEGETYYFKDGFVQEN